MDDTFGHAAQIFDQRDAQRDRDRPELADRQRLDFLVGVDEGCQFLNVERAIAVGNDCPRDTEHAWVALERTIEQFWQSTIEFRRQVVDRKSTRLNSSHSSISYAVFCLKKKKNCRVSSD